MYATMRVLKAQHSIAKMAKVFGVSRSGYYAWAGRKPSRHAEADRIISMRIERIFIEHHKRYGSPRIRAELRSEGVRVGEKRVARLMQEGGWAARQRKRFARTPNTKHTNALCGNRLGRNFQAEHPGEKWVSDITYLKTSCGWLYLAIMLDLYDRKVIGWAIAESLESRGVCDALGMAIKNRQPREGMIFHSDQGIQYCSDEFREYLKCVCPTAEQSMSRRGNCWDNACAESFFKTLKTELEVFDGKHTKKEVRSAVFEYIEIYYNRHRRHSALNYDTPLAVTEGKSA